MSYNEWKNAKATSQSISEQEDKDEAIRYSYLKDYRGLINGDGNVALNVDKGYYRNKCKQFPAEGYSEPFSKKHVKKIMNEMGID